MKSKPKKKINVFFNASVVIAGILSPNGGSGQLIKWVKQKKIVGVISEIIVDEIIRQTKRINIKSLSQINNVTDDFIIIKAPSEKIVVYYQSITIDPGDAHVLSSAREIKTDYLVSLDKKHIISLSSKIKTYKIVTPKQLIEKLNRSK